MKDRRMTPVLKDALSEICILHLPLPLPIHRRSGQWSIDRSYLRLAFLSFILSPISVPQVREHAGPAKRTHEADRVVPRVFASLSRAARLLPAVPMHLNEELVDDAVRGGHGPDS